MLLTWIPLKRNQANQQNLLNQPKVRNLKKPTKKERLQRMKNIYCGTDLFILYVKIIWKKSIEKLCSLSKCDTLWSDNSDYTRIYRFR